MKYLILLFLLFFINVDTVFGQSNAYQELKYLLIDRGYSVSTEKYGYLTKGESAGYSKTFYANTTYVIVALSTSSSVQDVDVQLLDSDGTVLARDTDSNVLAVVEYTPRVSRTMRAVMKNYASYSGSHKCQLIIFYK